MGHFSVEISRPPGSVLSGNQQRKMLDEGLHGTIEDLARAKGVHATYASRVLRLTLLATEIVEAILDGASAGGAPVG